MNESKHPDHALLNAYAHQPDDEDFRQVSLHLLGCKQCRDEVNLSSRLKSDFCSLDYGQCTEDQQRVVEDFLYSEKSIQQQQQLKQKILNDPVLLKSALFSLSHRTRQNETLPGSHPVNSQKPAKGWFGVINEWLVMQTSTWATMGVTAVVTLSITVFLLQQHSFDSNATDNISIASYQDNDVIRFFPRDQLPGIGFFNGAMQSSQSYQNLQISSDQHQMLKLSWKPVESASTYEFILYRFSRGEKKLLETFKTRETFTHFQLGTADYNQRFEWVLSGHTSDDRTFVTSGGFIVQKQSNRGDL